MKKVGLLIPSLNNGGAERVVSRLTKILENTYDIYLIVYEDTYMYYDYCGKLVNMNIKSEKNKVKKLLLPLRRTNKLRKLKKDLKLDVVISFMESPNIVNILSRVKKCKTIVSVRNYNQKEKKISLEAKALVEIMKVLYKYCDAIIPVSKLIAKSLVEDYSVDRKKIKCIYNPYDIDSIEFEKNEQVEEDIYNFCKDKNVIMSVGRNMYQKGFWHLIKAFKLAYENDTSLRLLIVGRNELEEKSTRLIDDLDLRDVVKFIGYTKNPFKYIKMAKVYVLTSLFEGFPNSLVEAMACEKAVIATDCKSGPREILDKECDFFYEIDTIKHTSYGVLIPPMDEEEDWEYSHYTKSEKILAEAIIEMIINVELNYKYSKLAKKRALEFNYDNCRKAYCDIINRVCLNNI